MSERPIIADSGPLISLARVSRLSLLQRLFDVVRIPDAVMREVTQGVADGRPGAAEVRAAAWIEVAQVPETATAGYSLLVDAGEAAAIALAAPLRRSPRGGRGKPPTRVSSCTLRSLACVLTGTVESRRLGYARSFPIFPMRAPSARRWFALKSRASCRWCRPGRGTRWRRSSARVSPTWSFGFPCEPAGQPARYHKPFDRTAVTVRRNKSAGSHVIPNAPNVRASSPLAHADCE